jgi:hypothetical protein
MENVFQPERVPIRTDGGFSLTIADGTIVVDRAADDGSDPARVAARNGI